RPVAITDNVAVVGEGEELGHTLPATQLDVDIGLGHGTQRQSGECCSPYSGFQHAHILFGNLPR
nr:hypothetical protein [Tanacetum cinerariifolium]